MKKITTPTKRKSKGKRHPAHAASFIRMADSLDELGVANYPIYKSDLQRILRNEAKHLRSIVR